MAKTHVRLTPELRRRITAARAYAGGLSYEDFADRIGIGRMTLIRTENGERTEIKQMELREIAEASGLPLEFFTADLGRLTELPPSLDERLTALEQSVRQVAADLSDPDVARPPRFAPPSAGASDAPETAEEAKP